MSSCPPLPGPGPAPAPPPLRGSMAQRVALVAARERPDPRRQRRRQQQRAALGGRGLEQLLQILAKPEIEHLVGLVEHHHPQVAQLRGAARRSRSTSRPGVPITSSTPRWSALRSPITGVPPVHDAEAEAAAGKQPAQLLAHLRGQLARRHDHQRDRVRAMRNGASAAASNESAIAAPKAIVLPEPVCDDTSRSRPAHAGVQHRRLDAGRRLVAARGERGCAARGECSGRRTSRGWMSNP